MAASLDKKDTILEAVPSVSRPPDTKSLGHHKTPSNPFDPRNLKWMWTGLTFGKTTSEKFTAPPTPAPEDGSSAKSNAPEVPEVKIDEVPEQKQLASVEIEVDAESLREAMSTENAHSPVSRPSSVLPSPSPPSSASIHIPDEEIATTKELDIETEEDAVSQIELDSTSVDQDGSPASHEDEVVVHEDDASNNAVTADRVKSGPVEDLQTPRLPPPTFLSTTVHLSVKSAPTETKRKKVLHATVYFALHRAIPDG